MDLTLKYMVMCAKAKEIQSHWATEPWSNETVGEKVDSHEESMSDKSCSNIHPGDYYIHDTRWPGFYQWSNVCGKNTEELSGKKQLVYRMDSLQVDTWRLSHKQLISIAKWLPRLDQLLFIIDKDGTKAMQIVMEHCSKKTFGKCLFDKGLSIEEYALMTLMAKKHKKYWMAKRSRWHS
jgi:hypothetical protein